LGKILLEHKLKIYFDNLIIKLKKWKKKILMNQLAVLEEGAEGEEVEEEEVWDVIQKVSVWDRKEIAFALNVVQKLLTKQESPVMNKHAPSAEQK
jgi:hypothetical protein